MHWSWLIWGLFSVYSIIFAYAKSFGAKSVCFVKWKNETLAFKTSDFLFNVVCVPSNPILHIPIGFLQHKMALYNQYIFVNTKVKSIMQSVAYSVVVNLFEETDGTNASQKGEHNTGLNCSPGVHEANLASKYMIMKLQ